MPRALDPIIADKIKEFGLDPADSKSVVWDCHGTWVIYHRALERISAKAGIVFDLPQVLEANGASKSVALCVAGRLGDKTEWSVGEAAPANCKNSYPYAMAEKRAKDRVILKLIGLHGEAYSEDEADNFKPNAINLEVANAAAIEQEAPAPHFADESKRRYIEQCKEKIAQLSITEAELRGWWRNEQTNRRSFGLTQDEVDQLKKLLTERLDKLKRAA